MPFRPSYFDLKNRYELGVKCTRSRYLAAILFRDDQRAALMAENRDILTTERGFPNRLQSLAAMSDP